MVQLYQGRWEVRQTQKSWTHRDFMAGKDPQAQPQNGPLNHTMKGMLMCSARAGQELDSILPAQLIL